MPVPQIKNYTQHFLLAFTFFCVSCSAQSSLKGKVISVKDGDTIELLVGKTTYRIRLVDIDAPELGQDFGASAKKFTSDKCFGKQTEVLYKKKDQYGRILGVVFIGGDYNLNEELVKAGFAWKFNYSNNKYIARLEQNARKQRIGLWQGKNPIPPWEFRKAKPRKK